MIGTENKEKTNLSTCPWRDPGLDRERDTAHNKNTAWKRLFEESDMVPQETQGQRGALCPDDRHGAQGSPEVVEEHKIHGGGS